MTTVGQLEPIFINLINSTMAAERQPLVRLQQRRDEINVQKAIYTDLKNLLEELKTSVKALISTEPFFSLTPGRKVSVNNAPAGSTVASASASASAVPGSYQIVVSQLAREHRIRSAQQSTDALNFSGTFSLNGVQIHVDESDTLADIASKINKADFAADQKVIASVIDNHLVLSHSRSGAGLTIFAQDEDENQVLQSLGILNGQGNFANILQTAQDAVFTVNSMLVTRASNSGLTDVISGLTINLAADAEGKSVSLLVSADSTNERSTVNNFLQRFNRLTAYLGERTATIKQADGTYTRGSLAGESVFTSLRMDLLRLMNGSISSSGSIRRLSDIGISFNDKLTLSISDNNAFEKAFLGDRHSVISYFDDVMGKISETLERFTGTSGYMQTAQRSLEMQFENTSNRISTLTERLKMREATLYKQYAEVQAQLISMSYMQTQMSSIYGNFYRSS